MQHVSIDLVAVTHVGTSRSGNPTYRLDASDGRTFLTATDSSVGYAASNYQPHKHWGQERLSVDLVMEGGRVVGIEGPDAWEVAGL